MEELIVGLLLVENAWCQKQSWSFMHLLCSGMVGFGLRRKLGTAGTERHSPPSSSSMAGGILVLSSGFVLFSTVVFLGDPEFYFFVPVSGHWGSRQDGWTGGPGRQKGGQGRQRGGGQRAYKHTSHYCVHGLVAGQGMLEFKKFKGSPP